MNRPLLLIVDDNQELADLLGQLLEGTGYRTRICYRAGEALEALAQERPAAAVVDLLLPDKVGYEVGKALAAVEVPYVFMTGVFKGDLLAEEGLGAHGARAYFQKPFESSALVRKMQELAPLAAELEPDPLQGIDVDIDLTSIDVESGDTLAPMELELTGRIAVGGGAVQAVLTGKDFRLEKPTPGSTLLRPRPPGASEARSPGELARSGALSDNLPQLLSAFWQLRETGELLLERGRVKKVVCFEKGWPVFAISNLASDRFGSFLVRVGRISAEQLQEAVARGSAEKRRTGDMLIEMSLLTDAERMYYVAQQVKAIIYSLFAWSEGSYRMSFRDKARLEPIRLGMHPAQLINRGIKKLYKPERLRRILAPEDRLGPARDPVFQLTEMELEMWESRLMGEVSGERTVAELVAMSDKAEEAVYATLVSLLSLRVLERR